jgi:hypothetical protein
LKWLRKNSHPVIPKGWVCPRNLLFLGFGEEKQIPRFARDDKKALFPQPVEAVPYKDLQLQLRLFRTVEFGPCQDETRQAALHCRSG